MVEAVLVLRSGISFRSMSCVTLCGVTTDTSEELLSSPMELFCSLQDMVLQEKPLPALTAIRSRGSVREVCITGPDVLICAGY